MPQKTSIAGTLVRRIESAELTLTLDPEDFLYLVTSVVRETSCIHQILFQVAELFTLLAEWCH